MRSLQRRPARHPGIRLPARRGVLAAALLLAIALLLLPGPAAAHETLRSSQPAKGARLATPPAVVRLVFARAAEAAVSEIRLTGPAGEVPLSPPRRPGDSVAVLVADVRGAMPAGEYRVAWRIIGADGHPVRGEYSFTLAPAEGAAASAGAAPGAPGVVAPAAGQAAGDTAAAPAAPHDAAAHDEPHDDSHAPASVADTNAPGYVALRWLTLAATLALVGAVVLRLLVLPRAARLSPAAAALVPDASQRARLVVSIAVAALLLLTPLRLVVQALATDPDRAFDAGFLAALVGGTVWGMGWILQAVSVLLVLAALAAHERPGRWTVIAVGAAGLSIAPALSGHAVAASIAVPVAVLLDGLHVVGAGGWLGTLLALAVAALPAAMRLQPAERGPAGAALVTSFSPLALGFAGLVAASGAITALVHLGGIGALFSSGYGRVVLVKLALVGAVAAVGAYNWRVVRPRLGDEAGVVRVRRSSTAELLLGALVLLATAVLVATPLPSHEAGAEREGEAAGVSPRAGATD